MERATDSKASRATFDTYEILENILSKLPMKKLLKAQEVCKVRRDLIARSKTLQQELFLEPWCPAGTEANDSDGYATDYHDTTEEKIAAIKFKARMVEECYHDQEPRPLTLLRVHPLLEHAFSIKGCELCEEYCEYKLDSDNAIAAMLDWPAMFEGSTMLLTQPPANEVELVSSLEHVED